MEATSAGATGGRTRRLGLLAGACLLVVAAALVVWPMTVEVSGVSATCSAPLLALRAPSEPDDEGFDPVEDACAGAASLRVAGALLVGGAGVAIVVVSRRVGTAEARGVRRSGRGRP